MRRVTDVTFTGDVQGFEVFTLSHPRTEPEYARPGVTKYNDRRRGNTYTMCRDVSSGAIAAAGSG